jgi:hypothetical protein
MNKGIILIIFIGYLANAYSMGKSVTKLSICLGQEEQKLHREKNQGPMLDLNQKLINEVVQLMGIDATKDALNQICSEKYPSLKLLELIVMSPKTWWEISEQMKISHRELALQLVKELNEQGFDLLLLFLQRLQSEASHAQCFPKAIPETQYIYNQIKHLQEDLDPQDIVPPREKLQLIFNKIKFWPEILKKCKQESKKKSKPKKIQN